MQVQMQRFECREYVDRGGQTNNCLDDEMDDEMDEEMTKRANQRLAACIVCLVGDTQEERDMRDYELCVPRF